MRVWRAHAHAITGLAFSPDGKWLLTIADHDPGAKLWDRFGTSEPLRLSVLQEPALAIAFSPDGRLVAIGRAWAVELWNLSDFERLVRLESLHHYSRSLTFAADGRTLLSAGVRRRKPALDSLHSVIWNIDTRRATHDIDFRTEEYRGLTVALDATRFLWAHGRGDLSDEMPATITDVPSRQNLALLNAPGPILSAALAPDGKTLATAVRTLVYFWPLGMALGRETPDAAWLSAAEVRRLGGREDEPPSILPVAGLNGPAERIDALAFTPDGQYLLTATAKGTIRQWHVPDRLQPELAVNGPVWFDSPAAEYDWQIGAITTLAVAPDGLTAAAGNSDGEVLMWDLDA